VSYADTVLSLLHAIEADDFAQAASYLTNDFTLGGAVRQPLDSQQWLGFHQALTRACPDFSFNARIVGETGDQVTVMVELTGTQTNVFSFPPFGIVDVAPTGKRVHLPQEPVDVTLRGEQVATISVQHVSGGGLPGILSQLGIKLPD
jgi:predicted ester cyclase